MTVLCTDSKQHPTAVDHKGTEIILSLDEDSRTRWNDRSRPVKSACIVINRKSSPGCLCCWLVMLRN